MSNDVEKVKKDRNNENCKLFSICEIRPYLYISGYSTLTAQKLRQYQITYCVDATHIPKALMVPDLKYLIVPVNDTETSRINQFFEPVAEFVQQAKNSVIIKNPKKNLFFKGCKALIYCAAGISRSAALCMISLMIIEGCSLREAYMNVVR